MVECKIIAILSVVVSIQVFFEPDWSFRGNIINLSCCYLNYIVIVLLLFFALKCFNHKAKRKGSDPTTKV